MAVLHSVPLNQGTCVRPLPDGQGASGSVADDLDAKYEGGLSQILHIELACQLLFEELELRQMVAGDEEVVYIE
jgi:hypothetical protein